MKTHQAGIREALKPNQRNRAVRALRNSNLGQLRRIRSRDRPILLHLKINRKTTDKTRQMMINKPLTGFTR